MSKYFRNLLLLGVVALSSSVINGNLHAYTKKAAYEGYGQVSKTTGGPKTKIVSGHVKKTSNGYTYVNPYARS